jgi:hypothetical protein
VLSDDTGALRVDPRLLAHTAGRVLDTALELSTQARALVAALVVPASAFGAADPFGAVGARFGREADAGVEDAQSTLDRLAAELCGDADKLYRTAFAALAADTAAMPGVS